MRCALDPGEPRATSRPLRAARVSASATTWVLDPVPFLCFFHSSPPAFYLGFPISTLPPSRSPHGLFLPLIGPQFLCPFPALCSLPNFNCTNPQFFSSFSPYPVVGFVGVDYFALSFVNSFLHVISHPPDANLQHDVVASSFSLFQPFFATCRIRHSPCVSYIDQLGWFLSSFLF